MKNIILLVLFAITTQTINTQDLTLEINPEVRLPKDSLESKTLIYSLQHFLKTAETDASNYEWVYPAELSETTLLLDEVLGLQKFAQNEDTLTYKPVLIDLSPLGEGLYFIQVSYDGLADKAPKVRAVVELIAHKSEDKYLFSSPLVHNTKNWKSTSIENFTFHYENSLDMEKSKEYIKLRNFHDSNLEIKEKAVTHYLLEDGLRTQAYFGLPFKADYSGYAGQMTWRVILDNEEIHFSHKSDLLDFDPHDLWHNRLNQIISRRKVNHSVDEGIACLYGGSYGVSWKDLFVAFQDQIKFDENTDWLTLKAEKVSFITDGHKNPTDFMVNGLFAKKIEKERGFSGVMKLLKAKEEEDYATVLSEVTGITKETYNIEVWKLVKQEMDELGIKLLIN